MKVRFNNVQEPRRKLDGRIMFPTTHDITPEVVLPCMIVLEKMLLAGNEVLIVLKPHLRVVRLICEWFDGFRSRILFRFTIGSASSSILRYWEPGAPSFEERLESLKWAHRLGFETSVSSEPLLDMEGVCRLGEAVLPLISDAWWIGKMNKIKDRVTFFSEEDRRMVKMIEDGQTDEKIKALYEIYKDNPKVKWKESVKEIVGLALPTEVGEDK
jgi:DNA repair photolyase